MPKRSRRTEPQADSFESGPYAQRARTFWLGAQSWVYDPFTTTKARPRTTFLDLPLELREEIYHHALAPIKETLAHPWDDLPGHDRFEPYAILRLLNRQISGEVRGLFKKHYEQHITWYFDNPPDLYKMYVQFENHKLIQHAKFYLRTINNGKEKADRGPGGNAAREDVEMLIEWQPGYDEFWISAPSMYFHGWGSYGWPDRSKFKIESKTCGNCNSNTRMCVKYRKVTFPPLEQSLRTFTYLWKQDFRDERHPGFKKSYRIGSLVLTGKIADISWDDYDYEQSCVRLNSQLEWEECQRPSGDLEGDNSTRLPDLYWSNPVQDSDDEDSESQSDSEGEPLESDSEDEQAPRRGTNNK